MDFHISLTLFSVIACLFVHLLSLCILFFFATSMISFSVFLLSFLTLSLPGLLSFFSITSFSITFSTILIALSFCVTIIFFVLLLRLAVSFPSICGLALLFPSFFSPIPFPFAFLSSFFAIQWVTSTPLFFFLTLLLFFFPTLLLFFFPTPLLLFFYLTPLFFFFPTPIFFFPIIFSSACYPPLSKDMLNCQMPHFGHKFKLSDHHHLLFPRL